MFQKMAPGTLLANLERNSHSWRRMRWTPGGLSKNIEDRRGSSGRGFGMAPMGIGGTIILLVLGLIFGVDLTGSGDGGSPIPQSSGGEVGAPVNESPEEAQLSQFVSFVLDAPLNLLEPSPIGFKINVIVSAAGLPPPPEGEGRPWDAWKAVWMGVE